MAFRTTPMTKVRITGPKSLIRESIQALHELQLIHLVSYQKKDKDYFNIGTPLDQADLYSKAIVNTRAILEYFHIQGKGKIISNVNNALNELDQTYNSFHARNQAVRQIQEKVNQLESQFNDPVNRLQIQPEVRATAYKNLEIFTGTLKPFNEQELKNITPDYILFREPGKEKHAIALYVPHGKTETVHAWLRMHGFQESKKGIVAIQEVERELTHARRELEVTQKELEKIKNQASFLLDLEYTLANELEQAEAPLHFATSLHSFIIRGWIPKQKISAFEKKLSTAAREKIHIEEIPGNVEEAPVKLNNPKAIEPFEFFLNLYSLPKYYEIDPTLLTALTFPLFFGFMLGDVGYGVIVLALCWLIKKFTKSKQLHVLANMITIASIATIIFGFVYGEAFGITFLEKPLLHRTVEIMLMLGIAILIGFIHVNIGFLLGFYNKYKQHGFKHAFLEKGSWLIVELGAIILAVSMFKMASIPFGEIVGGIIAITGVVLLYMGEGARGIVELPGMVGNMLSYARLFALGLAGAKLAAIVNQLAGQVIGLGILGWVLAIFIILVGHGINLFLGLLGPFIHSMRLHYVEFFTKFFEGGGQEYRPFGVKR